MSEDKQSIWKRPWSGWRKVIVCFLLLVGTFFLVILGATLAKNPGAHVTEIFTFTLIFSVCASLAGISAIVFIRWLRHWRNVRRVLFGAACFATLMAIFYAEENWRGKRAWEKCKRDFEAKGDSLDWSALIPPSVPRRPKLF